MTASARIALLLIASLFLIGSLFAADPAFVRVSPRDSRYFELSDGRAYIPIGLNMIAPGESDEEKGLAQMEQWLDSLADNQGNFIRIWMSNRFFDVESEKSGSYDAETAKRLDAVLEKAGRRGIRVKLTFEHFRHFFREEQKWAAKPIHHVSRGGPASDESDFFSGPASRDQFRRKIDWFSRRYGSNPDVFAWELWNEINAVRAQGWEDWTEVMLKELRARFPRNLVTQSLGSFDTAKVRDKYRWLALLTGNDVAQVHRYLDLGASLEICHGPVDVLTADAVQELIRFNPGKPVVLAESGAVEPGHSGPFKLYAKDKSGIILHDVLFAPFFSGAAAAGQIWHWDQYVAANNLWFQFARFAEAVKEIDPPAERFQAVELPHERLRIRMLRGRSTLLVWCRDRNDDWRTELEQGIQPGRVERAVLDFRNNLPASKLRVRFYDPWENKWTEGRVRSGKVALPPFSRSMVVRIETSE